MKNNVCIKELNVCRNDIVIHHKFHSVTFAHKNMNLHKYQPFNVN